MNAWCPIILGEGTQIVDSAALLAWIDDQADKTHGREEVRNSKMCPIVSTCA